MITVNVAELKQRLSAYLHRVGEGEEIVVTSHQRRVARVIPEPDGLAIRPPSRRPRELAGVKGVRMGTGRPAVAVLLEDRDRR
jgi:prevent-host-death family protein